MAKQKVCAVCGKSINGKWVWEKWAAPGRKTPSLFICMECGPGHYFDADGKPVMVTR